jgi:hypothetical protein
MSEYRFPEESMLHGATTNIVNNDLIKINTYAIKKTLTLIAFFDFFIQLLNGFSFTTQTSDQDIQIYGYISFGCATLILLGIYGINRYYRYISYGYGLYLSLQIISRLLLLIFYQLNLLTTIFSVILLFVNGWLLKLLCKFTSNIKSLTEDDLQELKNGWVPTVIYRSVYY